MVRRCERVGRRGERGTGRRDTSRERLRSAGGFAARAGVAPRAWLPLYASCQSARRSGNRVPYSDRKERTKRMSWIAFTALVRRDLRLFFQDKRALTMSFVAPILIGS